MPTLTVVANQLKDRLKRHSPALLRWMGLRLLNKAQTEDLLRPAQLGRVVKEPIWLGEVTDIADADKVIFAPVSVQTDPDFVWDYVNSTGRAELLRSGNLSVDNKFVDTDFGNRALLNDLFVPDRRSVESHPLVIAPWSHYWGSYYDFVLFVAAKMARMKAALPPGTFAGAVVSYPLFQLPFEAELLTLLGISPDRIIDSRHQAVRFDRCILANNSSWFYPAAADVLALKAIVEAQTKTSNDLPSKRLYISRTGRRRVVNETELVAMLDRYGVDIVEDRHRSVAEQVALYRSASLIIGPHGASFANLLWCQPGTQLLELFAPNYRPEYFRYLAHVLGLRYAAYCYGPVVESHHTHVETDIYVSVAEVEQSLIALLGPPNRPLPA